MPQEKLVNLLARSIARCIYHFQIHTVFYFILLLVSFIHILIALAMQQSQLYIALKWFDLSTLIKSQIIIYLLIVPVFVTVAALLISFFWNVKSNSLQTDLKMHYIIKTSFSLGYILGNTATLPVFRAGSQILSAQSESDTALKIIAIILMILYTLGIYLPCLFIFRDYSPSSNKADSLVSKFGTTNCYNAYRLLLTIVSVCATKQNSIFIIIPTIFFVCVFVFSIYKYPVDNLKFNKIVQAGISCCIWFMLSRCVEEIYGQPLPILILIIALPASIGFALWVIRHRIISILMQQTISSQKIKILFFLLVNIQLSRQKLSVVFMQHYRSCDKIQCNCRRVLEVYTKSNKEKQENQDKVQDTKLIGQVLKRSKYAFGQSLLVSGASKNQLSPLKVKQNKYKQSQLEKSIINKKSVKLKPENRQVGKKNKTASSQDEQQRKSKKQQLFMKERKCWFQFVLQLIEQKYSDKGIQSLPTTERMYRAKKIQETCIQKSQILLTYLQRNYQSLQSINFIKNSLEQAGLSKISFLISYYLQQQKYQQKIDDNCKSVHSMTYGLNYINLQIYLLAFRKLILKVTLKVTDFWKQLQSNEPDNHKICYLVEDINKFLKKIRRQYDLYTFRTMNSHDNTHNGSEYEKKWKKKVKKIVDAIYLPFKSSLQEANPIQLNNKLGSMSGFSYSEKQIKKQEKLSKLLRIFDSDSKTPMCLVKVDKGPQFGNISMGNKQFWQLVQFPFVSQIHLNRFIPQQFWLDHQKIMLEFLNHNKQQSHQIHSFLKLSPQKLVEIDFFGLVYPNIFQGFQYAVFFQQKVRRPLSFIASINSGIISGTKFLFQYLSLVETKVPDLWNTIKDTPNFQQTKINDISPMKQLGQKVNLELFHILPNSVNHNDNLLFFQIQTNQVQNSELELMSRQMEKQQNNSNQIIDSIVQHKIGQSVYFSKTKKIDQEIKSQLQIQKLKSIVSSKKCKKVNCWEFFNLAIFFVMLCLAISIFFILGQRVQKFRYEYVSSKHLENIFIKMVQLSFSLRRMNYLSYEFSQGVSSEMPQIFATDDQLNKIQIFRSAINEYLLQISNFQNQINQIDWGQPILAFQLRTQNLVQSVQVNALMLYHKYIKASVTYILSLPNSQFSFDYLRSQINTPFSSAVTNLYNCIWNIQYVFLPFLSANQNFFDYEKGEPTKINIQDTLFKTIVPILDISIMVLCLVVLIVTIRIATAINNILSESYRLLEYLKRDSIAMRAKNIQNFRNICLTDLIQYEFPREQSIMETTIIQRQSTNIKKMENKLEMSDISARQLAGHSSFSQNNLGVQRKENKDPKNSKNKVKMHKFDQSKNVCKIILILLPIILLASISLILHGQNNMKFQNLLALKNVVARQNKQLLFLRNLLIQYGMQEEPFLESKNSIGIKITQILNSSFKMNKYIQSLIGKQVSENFQERYKLINSKSYCEIPPLLPQNPYSTYTTKGCDFYQLNYFSAKSFQQMSIYIMEQARIIIGQASNITQMTIQQRREYLKNSKPFFFEQRSAYQNRLWFYYLQAFDKDFDAFAQQYRMQFIVLTVFLALYTLLVALCWVKRMKRQFYGKIQLIQTVIQLTSFQQFEKDQELKNFLKSRMQKFQYLA